MNVEVLEKNKRKLTFDVSPERLEEGIQYSYKKNRAQMSLPGFRKGRVPRKLLEAQFGKDIFFEDAVNYILPDAYDSAVKESQLNVVSKPEIDIAEISLESGVVFTAEVFVKPEVTVSDYKGLPFTNEPVQVSDEEINKEIENEREKNARIITITDRPVQDGDIVSINYEGFLDGVPFEGGKDEGYELTIGSHTFIDNFEEQLIGHQVGDDLEINVTFPEDYHSEDLKGKAVTFNVEILDITSKELPEVNDDFAQDISEFDTIEDYKEHIHNTLKEDKEEEAKIKKQNEIVDKLIERTEMEVPEVMFDQHAAQMINDFANRLRTQGLELETYLQITGQNIDAMRSVYRQMAEIQVKGRLALEAVAAAESLEANDGEIDEELTRMAKTYGMEKDALASILRDSDKEGLKEDIKVRKAMELLIENAIPNNEEIAI